MHAFFINFIALIVFLFGIQLQITAQQEIPIGGWKSHLPFNVGKDVAIIGDDVYYAARYGLMKVPAENIWEFEFITRVEGLSDAEPFILRYNEKWEVLVVVYRNANVDLIFKDRIINLSDIKTSNIIAGERNINQVSFGEGNSIYFSCNFGLVQFDLESMSFGFTIITNAEVFQLSQWKDNYYMSTSNGLYRAPVNNFNHQNFTAWEKIGSQFGLPTNNYLSISNTVYQNALYFGADEDVYQYDGEEIVLYLTEPGFSPRFFNVTHNHLVVGWNCLEGCSKGRAMIFTPDGNLTEVSSGCINVINNIEIKSDGWMFVADEFNDVRYARGIDRDCSKFYPNSPYSANVTDMDVFEDVLYVASGGVRNNYLYQFRRDGYFTYKDGRWSASNLFNTPEFRNPDMFDFFQIKAHPTNGKLYIGTFWRGLIEVDGDKITIYDRENSCLDYFVPENLRERISGMAFDQLNRLWVTNDGALTPLVMFDNEGNCYNFDIPNFKLLTQLDVDFNGYKWAAVRDGGAGLVVFDEGDLDNPGDERIAVLTSGNSNLPNNQVLSVKTDLNGSVWVGTTDGVVVFDCTSQVFDGNCPGSRRRVEVEGFLAELLEGERVQTIAVDGANRKWFGTTNGVFVQSASGDEQVAFFDMSNSPLIDNNIISIAINDRTGEVFIGTARGIMSVRTDAVKGGTTHESEAHIFPNPVRPDYDGPIAIKGLARDARVKITDIKGNLVFETIANGGQAIWHGRDLEGRNVVSGVYMVYATTSGTAFSSPEGLVGRIMVVK
ncbi:MAG: hypothetical protein EA362_12215 [Saprospirales bacterium]|nr:MAG: hypothetical protein EA362_12215 [Saprospirales bacterium]